MQAGIGTGAQGGTRVAAPSKQEQPAIQPSAAIGAQTAVKSATRLAIRPTIQPTIRPTGQPTSQPTSRPSALTDAQLYRQCKYYGAQTKGWMRKFESLLAEVYRRRLYKRRGFAGIHEFAQKLAGMSRDKVDRILQLSKKLEDKPALMAVFEQGNVGYSKIAKVVYCANAQTDRKWATMVKICSRLQLELAVQEEQSNRGETVPGNSFEPEKMTDTSYGKSEVSRVSFNMNPETERKLRTLQRELEKAHGEKLSLGKTIEMLINKEHENLIEKAQRKRTINHCPDCVKRRANEAARKSEVTRAVPAEIRHSVLARQNYRCAGGGRARENNKNGLVETCAYPIDDGENGSVETCSRPPIELHHLDGWALINRHDPDRLQYLCKHHHDQIHAKDPRVQLYRSG